MKRKSLFVILIMVLLFGLTLVKINSQKVTVNKDLSQYAKQVLSACSSATYHQSCYDKAIPNLMDSPIRLSMEEAFQVTRLVQEEDRSFPYCHVLGHNLSAREVKKDPSKWKEVLGRCPSGLCSNGCIHGGFQERFRAESFTDEEVIAIKPDLATICEKRSGWNPTGLEQASCYHALGHLTMYITDADINKSVNLCREIAVKEDGRSFLPLCLDGVFMQIYQPLEPEDFALIVGKEITRSNVDNFCAGYSGDARASCLSESWPLYRQDIMNSPDQLIRFCSQEEIARQPRCYEGLFYVLTAQFNFDLDRIRNYCVALPQELEGKCFADSASRLIETDYRNIAKAVNLCDGVDECFNKLLEYSTYNFHKGSTEFFSLCNGLPDLWKNKCLN